MKLTFKKPGLRFAKLRDVVSPLLLTGLMVSGCISHSRTLPTSQVLLKGETISKSMLLARLKSQSLAVKTLKVAGSTLKPSRMQSQQAITEYIGVKAVIVVDRPNRIYVEIEKAGLTVIDMVSDAKQYSISIPLKGLYGMADVAAPADNVDFPYSLRPSHILDALFVDGEQYIGADGISTIVKEDRESQPDGLHSFYLINFNKGEIPIEDLWFDRTLSQVTRKKTYKDDGRVESDVHYSNYEMVNSVPFPKMIQINRPIENYSLEIRFQDLELNATVDSSAFTLERPSGAVDIDLTTGKVIKSP